MPGKGANWCWEGGTLITTSDGDLPIESIVRQKLPTEVLSYNQNKKTLEWKKIINYWENQPNDDFYKIYLDKDKFSLGTGNHKIYTKEEGELEMKNCNQKTGLELKRVLSDAQKQLIYGSLLGDSSIYGTKNKLFRCGHGPKQLNYLKLKAEMLKEFMGAGIYEDKKRQDGEWKARSTFILNTRRNEVFTEIYKVCYSDKKKYVTKKWLDKIDERGLCFWFLDDGTVTRKKNGNKLTASIATLSFSKEDMDILSNWLKKKWELNHTILKVKKYEGRDMGYQICFSSISTKKLLKLIAPYVIPCMSYKVNIFPYEKPCNTCGKGINPRYDNCDTCVLEQITKDMTEIEYRKLTTKKAASSRLFERYGGWKNAKKMALGLLPIKLSAAPIDNFKEIRELIGTKVYELFTESAPIGVKNKKLIIKKY
jgi:hypothetical protein